MRLLLATDHYPPFIGGAHVQTRLLAQELARRGHRVAVATPWHRGLPSHERDEAVEVHRLRQLRTAVARFVPPGVQQHQPPFADPVTTVQFRRVVREFRPDVVHSHGWFGYSCAVALTNLDVPLVLSARDYGYGCPKRTLLYGRELCSGPALRKCAGCASDHYGRTRGLISTFGVLGSRELLRRRTRSVHSVSTYVRDMVRRDFLDSGLDRIGEEVIPEAVPLPGPITPEVEADLARLPEVPFILFVGALRHEKGIPELLEAYTRLADAPPLVLVGTVERDTPDTFPPNVVVLPNFTHQAVLYAWDRALFGVFPSLLAEPMGTVVCEAVTRGKAVIGTRPGGHVDVLEDEVSGLTVPQGDVGALARAMHRLIHDQPLRTRLAEAARAAAGRFALESVVNRFEALYRSAHGRAA